jgi:hypothetical protein
MHTLKLLFFATVFFFALLACASAADIYSYSPSPLMLSPTDTSSPTFSPSAIMFIKDRAKAYGEQAAPDGTQYVAISDNDVREKSPGQIAAILAPKVNAVDVRKLDLVIDLKRPVTLSSNTNEPVNIGTAQVTAASHLNLDVRSQISISKVKVVPK